ncbi:MAG: hypothetical protein IT470_00255 [Pseudomonadales bacterium]|nr:hypothetical protein [Pseudomonadales bacterium]
MNQTSKTQLFPWWAFSLCVLLYAVLAAIGFDDIEEDAFIYFRFAENIANGYGYVFNIGGEKIEACSGLLWLGLITLLTFLPVHIVLATKLLCFIFGVLCLHRIFLLSQRFIANRFLSLWPAFLVLVSIPFYVWSLRGLETAFYWFVMLWLVDWVTDERKCHGWWLPAVALLNARPEGMFMLAAVLPYLYFCARDVSRFWRGVTWVGLVFVAVTVWRFWYFHDWVPHPFYFKVNPDHAQSFKNLLTYAWHAGWLLLLLLALPGALQRWQARDLALAGALLLSLLWTIFVFEDKAFNRHTGMALPFFYIFTLMLLARWWRPSGVLRYALCIFMVLLVAYTLVFSRYVHFKDSHPAPFSNNVLRALANQNDYWQSIARLIKNPDDFQEQPSGLGVFNIRYNLIASVGDFIHLNYRDDAVVIYDQIGQAPWYAGSRVFFIDNLGLGYRVIGLSRFHQAAQQSVIYRAYENMMAYLVSLFWPGERRYMSDDDIVAGIMAKQPDVIVARKGYIAKERNNILTLILRNPELLAHYQARYVLNNREIIFERRQPLREYRLYPNGEFKTPKAATVRRIASFRWCDNAPCIELNQDDGAASGVAAP